jgi:hypothetical protein
MFRRSQERAGPLEPTPAGPMPRPQALAGNDRRETRQARPVSAQPIGSTRNQPAAENA